MKTKITDLARERTELRLREEVRGMDEYQREKYLSSMARLIEDMLSERSITDDGYSEYLGVDSSHDSRGFKK